MVHFPNSTFTGRASSREEENTNSQQTTKTEGAIQGTRDRRSRKVRKKTLEWRGKKECSQELTKGQMGGYGGVPRSGRGRLCRKEFSGAEKEGDPSNRMCRISANVNQRKKTEKKKETSEGAAACLSGTRRQN